MPSLHGVATACVLCVSAMRTLPNFVSITVVLQLHEGTTPILVRILLRFLRRYKTVGTFCARWGHP